MFIPIVECVVALGVGQHERPRQQRHDRECDEGEAHLQVEVDILLRSRRSDEPTRDGTDGPPSVKCVDDGTVVELLDQQSLVVQAMSVRASKAFMTIIATNTHATCGARASRRRQAVERI